MWSHITNAQYSVSERQVSSDYAEARKHRSDWMYATREGAGGAHAAQAGAMAAYQYQDVLQRTRVPADVDVCCYKMEEYKNTKGERGVVELLRMGRLLTLTHCTPASLFLTRRAHIYH